MRNMSHSLESRYRAVIQLGSWCDQLPFRHQECDARDDEHLGFIVRRFDINVRVAYESGKMEQFRGHRRVLLPQVDRSLPGEPLQLSETASYEI